MPSYIFDSEVSNPNKTVPGSLNFSLTSDNVRVDAFGTNADALLFNKKT